MSLTIEGLISKAEQSLRAAKVLDTHEFHDFAASRAYYAMFYCAEAILFSKGLEYTKHSAVISFFGKLFVKVQVIPERFHKYLIEGKEYRTVADYSLKNLSAMDSKEQIRRAKEFLDFTRIFLSDTDN